MAATDPFLSDEWGNSDFTYAILMDDIILAKIFIKQKNGLEFLMNYSEENFYYYIARYILDKSSNLREILGLKFDEMGAKTLFIEAKDAYERLDFDGSDLLDYYFKFY